MSLQVRVLCRPELAGGFGLAGLPTTEAASPQQAGDRLAELMSDPRTGVVLMQNALYDSLSEDTRRQIGRRALPMIVPFPDPAWAAPTDGAEAYIVELLRQVVGYRVRLR